MLIVNFANQTLQMYILLATETIARINKIILQISRDLAYYNRHYYQQKMNSKYNMISILLIPIVLLFIHKCVINYTDFRSTVFHCFLFVRDSLILLCKKEKYRLFCGLLQHIQWIHQGLRRWGLCGSGCSCLSQRKSTFLQLNWVHVARN